jgi:hypothetical protein
MEKNIMTDIKTMNINNLENDIKPVISAIEEAKPIITDIINTFSGSTTNNTTGTNGPTGSNLGTSQTSSHTGASGPANHGQTGVSGPANHGQTGQANGTNNQLTLGPSGPISYGGITFNPSGQLDDDNEVQITIDPTTGKQVYNGWTEQNTNTVRSWKGSVAKSAYIYQVVVEKYRKRENFVLIMVLILSALTTVISAVSSALLAIDSTKFLWATFGLNVAIFVISACITILNGLTGITQWNKLVTTLSTFIEKLDAFYAIVAGELLLADSIRHNAIDYIRVQSATFLSIMMQSPDIDPTDYELGDAKYTAYIQNDAKSSQFADIYNSNDNMIEVI